MDLRRNYCFNGRFMIVKYLKMRNVAVGWWLVLAVAMPAALVVQVAPPKTTGSRTVIKLTLKNNYAPHRSHH